VRGEDAAGNTGDADTYSWRIDLAAPDTTITTGPPASTTATTAEFTFESNESPATFQCSLDGAAFSTCSSPQTYTGLAPGAHNFRVRALDQAGNDDPSPASYDWTVAAPPLGVVGSSPEAQSPPTTKKKCKKGKKGKKKKCRKKKRK
jgi:hypothetical protein